MKKQIPMELTKKVMAQIKKDHLTMRPAWYFWVQRNISISILIITFTIAVFFINLTIFKFRFYDPFGYLVFGDTGFIAFWGSIPWQIIGFFTLTSLLLAILIKKMDFFYQYPQIKVFLLLTLLVFVLGRGVDLTGINEKVREDNRAPFLYHGIFNTEYWIMGQVISINSDSRTLNIQTLNSENIEVSIYKTTIIPGSKKLKPGDLIQAIGHREDHGIFNATGIHIKD